MERSISTTSSRAIGRRKLHRPEQERFITVHAKDGRELERYNVVIGSVISVCNGAEVKKAGTFVQWDPYNVPILTEKTGRVEFRDMIAGVTVKREIDEATGVMGTVVIEHKEDLHPQIVIIDEQKGDRRQLLDSGRGTRRGADENKKIRPVSCWRRRRVRLQRPRILPAVCHGWPNCSRLAVRKMRPKLLRSTVWLSLAELSVENAAYRSGTHQRPGRRAPYSVE